MLEEVIRHIYSLTYTWRYVQSFMMLNLVLALAPYLVK